MDQQRNEWEEEEEEVEQGLDTEEEPLKEKVAEPQEQTCCMCDVSKPAKLFGRKWIKKTGKYYLNKTCLKCENNIESMQYMYKTF